MEFSFNISEGRLYSESPFHGSELIFLDIGSEPIRYCVHRKFLEQSQALNAKITLLSWKSKNTNIIALPDIDESTAHTLVNYLYCGRYQALDQNEGSKKIKDSYKSRVLVYCASVRYNLDGLTGLAKEQIRILGARVMILDILSIARESAFPNLPPEDSWFSTYICDSIKLAAKSDPKFLSNSTFSDQIEGNRTFRHVVVKAILACQFNQSIEQEEEQEEDEGEEDEGVRGHVVTVEDAAKEEQSESWTIENNIEELAQKADTVQESEPSSDIEPTKEEDPMKEEEPTVEEKLSKEEILPVEEVPVETVDEYFWSSTKPSKKKKRSKKNLYVEA